MFWAVLAVTTGLIVGRPEPPVPMLQVNYVQGAAPVRINNQVVVFANAGHCCVGPDEAWEGVYALSGRAWRPLWAANQWGEEPARGEHEIAYPSVVWWPQQRAWAAAYAATLVESGQPRVWGGLALTRVDPLARWPIRVSQWMRPLGPGRAWGVFPIALLASETTPLVVWAWDYTAQRVIAYEVDVELGLRLAVVATFAGGPEAPALTDVARGPWQELYALQGMSHTTQEVVEWVSWPRCGWPAGWWWTKSGRRWDWPEHTVFDCGYLRDHLGNLEEPRVVVCNTSPGGVYADSGLWELRWFSDPGANVPLEWISRPLGRTLRGGRW